MLTKKQFAALEKESRNWLPGHSIDCVVLGFDGKLRVLLLKRVHSDKWALPGGFINKNEHLDDAARRALKDRTGLKTIYLSQFHTFGAFERRGKTEVDKTIQQLVSLNQHLANWFSQRFLTTGYFAFAEINKAHPEPDFLSEKCEWVDLEKIPELIFDHRDIIQKSLDYIRLRINFLPFGKTLLGKKFTMSELQKLYESILNKELDRGNFQKKILKMNFLYRHDKLLTGAANKAPYLYSFNKKRYDELTKEGIGYI